MQRSHLLQVGTNARDILARLLIDLSWNSSRLEGNTYSLLDTQRLIELGQAAEGKSARDATMILNHKQAIEFIVENSGEIALNPAARFQVRPSEYFAWRDISRR